MSSGDSDSESVVSSEVSSGGDLEAMMVLVTARGLFHFHVGPKEVKKLLWSAVKNKPAHYVSSQFIQPHNGQLAGQPQHYLI